MSKRRPALTLIELLVVVTILTILMAILLPSLRRAQEVSRQVLCMSILRQFGAAQGFYTIDWAGWYIPAADYREPAAPENNYNQLWFRNVDFQKYMNYPRPYSNWRYSMPGNYLCPSSVWDRSKGSEHPQVSWGYNYENLHGSRMFRGFSERLLRGSPSAKLMWADGLPWSIISTNSSLAFYKSSGGEYVVQVTGAYQENVAYRHLDTASVAFFDGHAAALTSAEIFGNTNLWQVNPKFQTESPNP